MDYGHEATEKLIKDIEKELQDIYLKCFADIEKELNKTYALIEKVGIEDLNERVRLINKSKRLEKLIINLSNDILGANNAAVSIINNGMYEAYFVNNAFATYLIEKASGINTNYNLFDKNAIKALVTKEVTPFTKIAYNGIKDKNTVIRDLKRELYQSLILGEGMDKLAKRMFVYNKKLGKYSGILARNLYESLRIARTEMNRVQNAGRYDAFNRGKSLGLNIKKKWISTNDDRTRYNHAEINLEERELDEPFSNGLLYPGSVGGAAKEVINCRCTMISEFEGLEKSAKELELDNKLKEMSYNNWISIKESKNKG